MTWQDPNLASDILNKLYSEKLGGEGELLVKISKLLLKVTKSDVSDDTVSVSSPTEWAGLDLEQMQLLNLTCKATT